MNKKVFELEIIGNLGESDFIQEQLGEHEGIEVKVVKPSRSLDPSTVLGIMGYSLFVVLKLQLHHQFPSHVQ